MKLEMVANHQNGKLLSIWLSEGILKRESSSETEDHTHAMETLVTGHNYNDTILCSNSA